MKYIGRFMSLSTKKVNKVSSVELIQIERRISIPQLQVRGALSRGDAYVSGS